MAVFWFAVVGALVLLVRRTWKASKNRRQAETIPAEPETEAPEEGF